MKEIRFPLMNSEKYYIEIAHIVHAMSFKKAKELDINITAQKTTSKGLPSSNTGGFLSLLSLFSSLL